MSESQYCVDASAIIAAWDERYAPDVFPSLWEKLAEKKELFCFLKPIFKEIEDKSPTLAEWLEEKGFAVLPVDTAIENESLSLQTKYETRENSTGADKNDLTLVAYAKLNNKTVVTVEANQSDTPKKKHNYKIPLVCREEGVECIHDLLKFLRVLSIKIP